MKPARLHYLLTAAAFALPALAHAHPGHDGDHDFVWDYTHLTAHPLATLLCGMVLTVGVWNLVLFLRARRSRDAEAGRSVGRDRPSTGSGP